MGMETGDREMCLKEISSEVIDSGKMVTISKLSENWNIDLKNASDLLEEWITQNPTAHCVKQFLLRGTSKDGRLVMSIVPEENLKKITLKCENHVKMLYSVNLGTEIPTIQIPAYLETKKKRLLLPESLLKRTSSGKSIETAPNPETKIEKEKPSVSQSSKAVTNGSTKSVLSMFKNVKNESKSPTKENKTNNTITSPKKKSPGKKEPVGKKNSTIGSFFSKRPAKQMDQPKAEAANAESIESDKEEKTECSKEETTNGKRNEHSSDEEIRRTPTANNPPKRRKLTSSTKTRKQGSRIMVFTDSEDEETDRKEVKSESEETVKEEKKTTPEAESVQTSSRRKRKRIVTRSYEDEDGYIKTVRETEEYSCSEEEQEPALKSEPVEIKKKIPSPKKSLPKGKPPTKQGSITSFFKKK